MENTFATNKIESADDFDISYFVYKYSKYWPLFVLLMIGGILGAFVYVNSKLPIYEVSATLLIKDEKKGLNESNILQSLDLFGSKKIVENEIVVLKSRDLLYDVAKNLKLYAPVYEEGKLKNKSAYTKSPLKIEVKHPELIYTKDKVHFRYNKEYQDVTIKNKTYPLNTWFKMGDDSIRFLLNPVYHHSSIEKPLYFSLINLDEIVSSINEKIDITSPSKQSSVINIKYKDEVPKRGVDILTELIRSYNMASIHDKNGLAENTLSFIEDRLHYLVQELDSVETSLQNYKSSRNIVDLSEQGKLFLANVGANDQKVGEINMQMAVMDEVEKYVVSKKEAMGIVPSTLGVNDLLLSQLLQKLYDLEIQQEKLKKTTGENNAITVAIRDQIEKIRPNILENIRNQRSNLTAARSRISSSNNRYEGMLQTLPQKEKELLSISRQQAIKNNIYTFLLQKREETALSFASAVADSRVVEKAASGLTPISPKKTMIYAAAIIGALVLGLFILIIKDLLDKNIALRSEIERYIAWPIIGEIGLEPSTRAIVTGENERSKIAEQFRQIRTALDYTGINENHKKILITSSISNEGKSFVSANLAVSLALTGKKVVLLELDLRKPKLSPLFHANRELGISNYLIGKADISMIIQPSGVNENLSFISCGPLPPNPSELILKSKMQELYKNLEVYYDYIIIDTAPVGPVTDAEILSRDADVTLYVIRQGHTPKAQLSKLKNNNKLRTLNNVAIIFNGVKERHHHNDGYSYNYNDHLYQEKESVLQNLMPRFMKKLKVI